MGKTIKIYDEDFRKSMEVGKIRKMSQAKLFHELIEKEQIRLDKLMEGQNKLFEDEK